ncbi:MAG: alkane 1-monooxygenase [Sphingomonadaceae bacterium]
MRYPLNYTGSLFIALIIVLGHYAGGVGHFAMPLLGFIVLPFADARVGYSRWPSPSALERITPGQEKGYERSLMMAALVDIALVIWALWVVSRETMLWWEYLGLTVSIGLFSGYIGIVVAHEMMHRSDRTHRGLGWVLMSLALYPHFCIEHVYGHHPNVATRADPATARRGESFYRFLPRSVFGGIASAWRIERARLARAGSGTFSPRNGLLLAWGGIALGLVAIGVGLGVQTLGFFIAQAAVAVILLEGINYLEHYGLLRALRDNGRPVPVATEHSWNSSHFLTNINLFNLGRHPEHHMQGSRAFYRLRHFDEAPQLPHGYATMFLIALIPPLWFRVMDRRLDEYAAGPGDLDAGSQASSAPHNHAITG